MKWGADLERMKRALYAGTVSRSIVIPLTPLPLYFSVSFPCSPYPPSTSFQIPTCPGPHFINIPLAKNRKRSLWNPGTGGRLRSLRAWPPGLPSRLRRRQSESPAQVCHYFLFHRKDLGVHFSLSQIHSCHPRQLALALGPWRHGTIIIISIKATILMTAAT